jgi:hypothetical protein
MENNKNPNINLPRNNTHEIHQTESQRAYDDLSKTRGKSSSNKDKIGDFATRVESYHPEAPFSRVGFLVSALAKLAHC